MIISMVATPSKSMSRGMSPRSARGLEQIDQPALHVGVEAGRDARDLGIAARLRHDLGAELDLLVGPLGEMVVRHAFEHGEEALRQVGAGELLRHLGAVALGDAGDERFLGGEVAVEVARAHAGLGADLLHRGLVEAVRTKQRWAAARISSRRSDCRWTLAARAIGSPRLCIATKENERSLSRRYGLTGALSTGSAGAERKLLRCSIAAVR